MSTFQFAATGAVQRRRDPPEPQRPRGGEPRQEEAPPSRTGLPDGAVQYIAQYILREGAPALTAEALAGEPAPAVDGWAVGEEALEKAREEAEALKRAAALQLSA